MGKKIFILSFILLVTIQLGKSQVISYPEVDRLTYNYWLEKDWKALIKLGNKSIKKGIDFYYLRVRMGIAYYNRKDYGNAAENFEKALEMNKEDYVFEYLFFSYLFSGQKINAYKALYRAPAGMRPKLKKYLHEGRQYRAIYAGMIKIASPEKVEIQDLDGINDLAGEQNIPESKFFVNVSTESLKDKSKLTGLSYNYYRINNLYRTQVNGDPIEQVNLTDNMHQINYTSNNYITRKSTFTFALTGIAVLHESIETYFARGRYYNRIDRRMYLDLLANVAYNYRLPKTDIKTGFTLSFINGDAQLQTDIDLIYYPFGNLNLYVRNDFIINYNVGDKFRTFFIGNLGFKVTNFLWLEPQWLVGTGRNFSYNNASIVYNTLENVRYSYGIKAIAPLKNMDIFFSYSNMAMQNEFTQQYDTETVLQGLINYNTNLFLGGLIWKL